MVFLLSIFLLLGLLSLLSVVWVIYDVVTKQKKMPDIEKLIWVLVALFLNILGAVVYYVVVKASRKYEE